MLLTVEKIRNFISAGNASRRGGLTDYCNTLEELPQVTSGFAALANRWPCSFWWLVLI